MPRKLSQQCNCGANQGAVTRLFCRFCAELPRDVAKERVEEREQKIILEKAARQVKCGVCDRRLPNTGTQWWICGKCRKECRSELHPQWAGSAEV
jgi:hypothetical protein